MPSISRFVDVRPGEGRVLARAFATLFAVIAGHTILETARDSLFLGKLPASRLPLVYVALAVLGVVLPSYNARFVALLGRRDAAVFTLMGAAFGTTLWHFQPGSPVVAYGLYLWSGLLGTVLVVQFWMLTGQIFTSAQGKRLFSALASGGVLGAVCGGVAAGAVLRFGSHLGASGAVGPLLPMAATLFVVAAMSMTTLPAPREDEPIGPASTPLHAAADMLREGPYVRRLALTLVVSTAALLATDYLFKSVAKATYPPEQLGSFFAQYYAALNGASLVMQIFFGVAIIKRAGVLSALAVLPVLLLGGSGAVFLLGGALVPVLLTKGADGALRHSLHRLSLELLYLPLAPEVRDRAKSLIDAAVVRGTQAATAGIILLLATFKLDRPRVLAPMIIGLSLGWVVMTWALRKPYLDLFRSRLRTGVVDRGMLELEELDLEAVEALMAALSSPEPPRVLAAMNLLVEADRAKLIPALVLHHDDATVVERALEILPEQQPTTWLDHVPRLLRSPSAEVRIAAVRALGRTQQLESLIDAFDDADPAVRAHVAFQLAQADPGEAPLAHPAILSLLQFAEENLDQRDAIRLGLIQALARDADARWADVLLELAAADAPDVIRSVAGAMARVADPRFVPVLIDRLGVRDGRSAVQDALVGLGEVAFEALEDALSADDTPAPVRQHLPRTIALFGTPEAARVLERCLEEQDDGIVRFKALRGLGRLSARSRIAIERGPVERQLRHDLIEHLRALSLREPLVRATWPEAAEQVGPLLVDLLGDKMSQAMDRVMRLFQLLHPREDVRSIHHGLQSSDRRLRADALEFLDALSLDGDAELRTLLLLVAEDLPPAAKVERAGAFVDDPPADVLGALERLLVDGDAAVVALAAFVALTFDQAGLNEQVDEVLEATPRLSYLREGLPQMQPEVAHG